MISERLSITVIPMNPNLRKTNKFQHKWQASDYGWQQNVLKSHYPFFRPMLLKICFHFRPPNTLKFILEKQTVVVLSLKQCFSWSARDWILQVLTNKQSLTTHSLQTRTRVSLRMMTLDSAPSLLLCEADLIYVSSNPFKTIPSYDTKLLLNSIHDYPLFDQRQQQILL